MNSEIGKAKVRFPGKSVAVAIGLSLLCAGGATFVFSPTAQFNPTPAAFAQEEGHGSGGSGGHESGGSGGHEGGVGHEDGGCSGGGGCGGGGGGGGHGGDGKGPQYHGAREGHQGHEAGMHGMQGRGGRSTEQEVIDRAAGSTSHHFGGGAELGGLEQVPEGPGQSGYSYGPGPQYQLRYWGGWAVPDGGGESIGTTTTVTTTTEAPTSTGGGGGAGMRLDLSGPMRCEGVSPKMSAAQRISGRNLARINGVQAMIGDPGIKPDTVAPFLLANFQEELQRAAPNTRLAGTYLGLTARKPVTPALVQKVSTSLCVRVSPSEAEAIAQAAEDQRLNGRKTAKHGTR